jgi:hypothetical protein
MNKDYCFPGSFFKFKNICWIKNNIALYIPYILKILIS